MPSIIRRTQNLAQLCQKHSVKHSGELLRCGDQFKVSSPYRIHKQTLFINAKKVKKVTHAMIYMKTKAEKNGGHKILFGKNTQL